VPLHQIPITSSNTGTEYNGRHKLCKKHDYERRYGRSPKKEIVGVPAEIIGKCQELMQKAPNQHYL
jgi:predicted oxidoreductase